MKILTRKGFHHLPRAEQEEDARRAPRTAAPSWHPAACGPRGGPAGRALGLLPPGDAGPRDGTLPRTRQGCSRARQPAGLRLEVQPAPCPCVPAWPSRALLAGRLPPERAAQPGGRCTPHCRLLLNGRWSGCFWCFLHTDSQAGGAPFSCCRVAAAGDCAHQCVPVTAGGCCARTGPATGVPAGLREGGGSHLRAVSSPTWADLPPAA